MRYLTFLAFIWLGLACKNVSPETSTSNVAQDLPEELKNFALFYEKFHGDSLFQIEHITFPLEGLPVQADSAAIMDNSFRWKQEDWVMHKKFDERASDYEREFLPIGETILVEKIVHKQTGFGMIRRFAKLGDNPDDWYLIYYAGMNKLVNTEANG